MHRIWNTCYDVCYSSFTLWCKGSDLTWQVNFFIVRDHMEMYNTNTAIISGTSDSMSQGWAHCVKSVQDVLRIGCIHHVPSLVHVRVALTDNMLTKYLLWVYREICILPSMQRVETYAMFPLTSNLLELWFTKQCWLTEILNQRSIQLSMSRNEYM